MQLVHRREPNISHLRKFGCDVYVPIAPPHRTTMGAQRKLGVYVGFDSPSIIKYLDPLTADLHTARFADCIFNEDHFPALGGGKYLSRDECREIKIGKLQESTEWIHIPVKPNQKFGIICTCKELLMKCQKLSPTLKRLLNLIYLQ